VLKCENITKTFDKGTATEKEVLCDINLSLDESDFITVIGGNGAGKSTLLNVIAGVYSPENGGVVNIDGRDVTRLAEHSRARFIGRVFQDPRMGTAPGMTIEENLAISYRRCKARTLRWYSNRKEREIYRGALSTLGLGLEDRLFAKVGTLSGGQRQALTLLMATLQKPRLLLLDEHTAALDPKTAKIVLELTNKLVSENRLTTLMVTHNMRDAIAAGNRIIMMHGGRIILDAKNEEKAGLTVPDLLKMFEKASGEEIANDRMLLA